MLPFLRIFALIMVPKIQFHTEDIPYKIKHKAVIRTWLQASAETEGYSIKTLNLILCTDEYLLKINNQFLQHDFYTDIITFDYTEDRNIDGELYISFDRIKENAFKNKVITENELYLILIHGLMHLCGYKDKAKKDVVRMREKEQHYLKKLILYAQNSST
jgi:probable rRNA maturation factor